MRRSPDGIRDVRGGIKEESSLSGHAVFVREFTSQIHVNCRGSGETAEYMSHLITQRFSGT